ncbi:MAG: hypothetical protein ABI632_10170 [Pseudolysinimonas sp.]
MAVEAESADALGFGESDKAFVRAAGYNSFGQFRRKSAMCLVVLDDQRVQVIPFKTNGEHMGQDQHVDSIDPDDRSLGLMVVDALARAATPVPLDGITDL